MAKHQEAVDQYEENTHREIFQRLNKTENKLAYMMGGIAVLSTLLLIFGAQIYGGINAQREAMVRISNTLSRIEERLKGFERQVSKIDAHERALIRLEK